MEELNIQETNTQNNEAPMDSGILTEEQERNINNGRPVNEGLDPETKLPSNEDKYTLPEKYQGKTAEEVYRLQMIEKEYLENKSAEGKGGDVPNENVSVNEDNTSETENDGKVEITESEMISITQRVMENNGVVTEEIYNELLAKGYSKEDVDNTKAGIEANVQTQVNETFSSAGTTVDAYQAAGAKVINEGIWDEQRIADYRASMDKAIKENDVVAQRNNIRMVMDAVSGMPTSEPQTFHSNQVNIEPKIKGYASRAEYAADLRALGNKRDSAARALIDKKFEMSDTSDWK